MAPRITAATEVGTEFAGRPHTLSPVRMLAFSGGPFETPGWPAQNLHTSREKAAEAGLAQPIASGVQYEGHLVDLMCELFGEAWFRHGFLHVKYPRPVMAGDTVTPGAKVRSRSDADDAVTFELEVWCARAEEDKVLVGTARCPVATAP